jgi:hypothetical protein
MVNTVQVRVAGQGASLATGMHATSISACVTHVGGNMAKRSNKPAASKPAASNVTAKLAAKLVPLVTPAPAPAQAPAATQVASTATKLTKRNNTAVSAVLVAVGKGPRNRAQHNANAWAAVLAALPATASTLATLPALAHPACVSPQAYLSYMVRRGHLAPQTTN